MDERVPRHSHASVVLSLLDICFHGPLPLYEVKHVTMSHGKIPKLEENEPLNLRQKEQQIELRCLLLIAKLQAKQLTENIYFRCESPVPFLHTEPTQDLSGCSLMKKGSGVTC